MSVAGLEGIASAIRYSLRPIRDGRILVRASDPTDESVG